MTVSKLQAAFATLVAVASVSLLIMGYGLYQQGQDIKDLQRDQARQTRYVCDQLAGLAERIATRTEPIRSLLRIEADEAAKRGDMTAAAKLNGLAERVLVPENVEC